MLDHAYNYTMQELAGKIRHQVGMSGTRTRIPGGLLGWVLSYRGTGVLDLPVEVELAADAIGWTVGSGRLPGGQVLAFRNLTDWATADLLAEVAVNYQKHSDVPPILRANLEGDTA